MPRIARVDAPGALHHVMVRGLEKREIFFDDDDRHDLLGRLAKLVPEWAGCCLAWVFMGNHVHMVLQTGERPLAWLMRRLNTGFAIHFNRRHDRVGYLFQDRFKSRLVAESDDPRVLLRYVHLNPLRAGLVGDLAQLERFPWSGHGALLGRRAPHAFESVDLALSLFDENPSRARRRLRGWMSAGVEEHEAPEAEAHEPPSPQPSPPRTAPAQPRRGPSHSADPGDPAPSLDELIAWVARRYGVQAAELARGSRHDRASRARAVIAFVSVAQHRLPANRLGEVLGVSPQAISKAIVRGERIAREDGLVLPEGILS